MRVRLELTAIYREAKHGQRDVSEASKLANILAPIGRLLEGGEMGRRVADLEKLLAERIR